MIIVTSSALIVHLIATVISFSRTVQLILVKIHSEMYSVSTQQNESAQVVVNPAQSSRLSKIFPSALDQAVIAQSKYHSIKATA